MTHVLLLRILPADVTAIADLEEELAPHTCALLLERLPLEGNLMHGRYSGPEIFVGRLDWPAVPPENLTHLPQLGDIGYFHIPPGLYAASPEGECEVVLIHDHGARICGPEGQPVWVNRCARVRRAGSEAFFKAAAEIRTRPGSLCIELADAADYPA